MVVYPSRYGLGIQIDAVQHDPAPLHAGVLHALVLVVPADAIGEPDSDTHIPWGSTGDDIEEFELGP
jgi:hypothetical protein